MMRVLAVVLSSAFACTAFAQAMSWPAVQKQLREHWKKTYPAEKILKLEQKGKLEYHATERRTEVDFSWGWVWDSRVIERNGAFARQVALVTVERANKTQARFEVAALFERMGNAWQSKGVAVRASQDLSAAKAGDLPSAAQAAAIFSEAWKKHRPDFDVHAVEVLKSEPRQHQERRWINYKLAITDRKSVV